jgi:hypothetical protein
MCPLVAYAALLLPAVPAGDGVATIDLGGPREVQAVVTAGPEEYAVKVTLLPVRCFDQVTNDRLSRDLARQYALQALVRHLSGKKTAELTVSGARVTVAGAQGKSYALTLTVPRAGVQVRAGHRVRPREGVETVTFDADLFTRQRDYLQTLDRLTAHLAVDLGALQKKAAGPGSDEEFALGIAELEERGLKNLEQLAAEAGGDHLLLFTEKEEITGRLAGAREKFLERLRQAVRRRNPKCRP